MKQEEFANGYVEDLYDPRDFDGEAFLGASDTVTDEFIVEVPFVTSQGRIPSCTAHAVTTMKWAQEGMRLSPRFNYAWFKYNDGYEGWGTSFRNALSVLQEHGAADEYLYPDQNNLPEDVYTDVSAIPSQLAESASKYKSKSYVRLQRSKENIQKMLMEQKTPILCGLPWFTNYSQYATANKGYLPEPSGKAYGHAVVCIGWRTVDGKTEFIFQNSWGKAWGDDGKFYLKEDELMRLYGGLYATIDMPKEEAKKVDTKFKKKKTQPLMDLRKMQTEGKLIVFDADSGKNYLNVGDKLLEISNERSGLAALQAIIRAGGGLGVKTEYLDGLTIEQF